MLKKNLAATLIALSLAVPALAQKFPKDGRLYLGTDSTRYFKFTLVNQLWLRHTSTNPGTQVYGFDKKERLIPYIGLTIRHSS
ncbi:MAG: hypothetical protein LH606_05845 [Cytophagaceae bacterium]|nr:hypothetical protein [Cytophagaceae bacterium]